MCGIAGFKSFGNERPTKEELEKLLIETMSRGKDATGVAWIENGGLQVFKKPVNASVFIQEKAWRGLQIPPMLIMHCRAATQGKPENNVNNHPIFNKNGMALTHNGVINNEKALYAQKNIKPDGEVDSEVILRLVEKGWWNDMKNLNELSGGFACAMIWEKKPDELILFRHSNPLAVYMDKQRDILFWASTVEILRDVFCKYHRGFMTSRITAYELSDDTAILVDKNGVVATKRLNPVPKYNFWGRETTDASKPKTRKFLGFDKCDICGKRTITRDYLGTSLCPTCLEEHKEEDDDCPYCESPFKTYDDFCSYCGHQRIRWQDY